MSFEMKCNMCGAMLRLQEDQVGSIINCPSCGQVIFVQLAAAGSTSDALTVSQPTPALSDPAEPELPEFMRPAQEVAPALAPREFPEADTGSSLAEMLEGEETGHHTAGPDPVPVNFEPPAASSESIDLSFLAPKLDTAIRLDSEPAAPSTMEPSPIVDELPWEQAAEKSSIGMTNETRSESALPAGPLRTDAKVTPRAVQSGDTEFPWMPAPERDEPATEPAPVPFNFGTPETAAPPPAAPAVSLAATAPALSPAQPEFFLRGAERESTRAVPATVATDLPIASPAATAATKSPSRVGVMAAVYVSGVIFGLIIGKFVFGRAAAATPRTGLEGVRDDGDFKKTKWVDPKAKIPQSQLKRLGETIEIAGLSISAHSITRAKVTKVHSFSQTKETSNEDCLVLRLNLRNTSKDLEFAPLDPMFVRPHNTRERPNYSFIELPDGPPILMFDLHKFSEFDLEGQPFTPLKPGETMDAIVAAEEGSPARAKGRMVWRVQLRAGAATDHTRPAHEQSYSTIIGFEFTPEQIRSGDG